MLLAAFLLAGISWLVSVISRRKMTSLQFMCTVTTAVGLIMASRIIVLEYEKKTERSFGAVDRATVFAPTNSDFAVTFSMKPTVEEFEVVTTDGVRLKGKRAELRAPDSFQRVEVVSMPQGFSESETKESAISKLREYAIHNGITAAEFKFEVSGLGPRTSMRGTKMLEDAGNPKAVTYEAVAYYGDSSLFSIYVGALSESYPPTRVVEFLQSVRKNPK